MQNYFNDFTLICTLICDYFIDIAVHYIVVGSQQVQQIPTLPATVTRLVE